MSEHDSQKIRNFITAYRRGDEASICFDWNGKFAGEFEDSNTAFRVAVLEFVLNDIESAPIELIRDLYRAETLCARAAWCIVDGVDMLGEALLRRGGEPYLDDFLEGKFQCFDTEQAVIFPVELAFAQRFLRCVRERISAQPDSPLVNRWRDGEQLFENWVAYCEKG
jgi:hypothetical protein